MSAWVGFGLGCIVGNDTTAGEKGVIREWKKNANKARSCFMKRKVYYTDYPEKMLIPGVYVTYSC